MTKTSTVDINTLLYDLKKLIRRWNDFGGSQGRKAMDAYDSGHMGDYDKLMNTAHSYLACGNQLEDVLSLRGYSLDSDA